jgi:hypothetical protein
MVRQYRRIAPAVGLALALAAAPASAMPQLSPPASSAAQTGQSSTSLCSEVCSAPNYGATRTGATLPHDPRSRSVALAGAGYGYGSTPIASGAPAATRSAHPATTVVRVSAPENGFDWGDAGIGAGGTLVLITLLGGGALALSGGRRRASRSTA